VAALPGPRARAARLSAAGLSYERFVWQLILNEQSGLDHV
jgi:16S rRNA C1402 (ribose-2'-O) methylase RsmI